MSYFLLSAGLVCCAVLFLTKKNLHQHANVNEINEKHRLDNILKFARLAPFIAVIIITILITTYLKTKFYIRLSHAWLAAVLWAMSAIYYYTFSLSRKVKKSLIALPAIGLLASISLAAYITPINHYEQIFHRLNLTIPNLAGLVFLLVLYVITGSYLKKDHSSYSGRQIKL